MLFAQESLDAPDLSSSSGLLIAVLLPLAGFAFILAIIVLSFRQQRFHREKLHTERLKLVEAGYSFEEPESAMRRQKYMHNAFWISFWMVFLLPSAAFSSAAAATDRVEHPAFLVPIWIGASLASIAAVVCAVVLMVHSRSSRDDDDEGPPKKPKPWAG